MQVVGRRRRFAGAPQVATAVVLASLLVGCGGSDAADDGAQTTVATSVGAASSTEGSVEDTQAASTLSSSTEATTAPTSTTAPTLDGAGEGQRSAPAEGKGTALLGQVRLGVHEGYERITFEFTGTTRPAYRIQWVDGPITADGSGEPVDVAGTAYLEVILQPASGFDVETGLATYTQPDRIPTVKDNDVLVDLVRTGDFEAVLTWVAGARGRVPFAVRSFTSPTRLVIDLASPDAVQGDPSEG